MADLQSLEALLRSSIPKEPTAKKGYDGRIMRLEAVLETKGRGGKTMTVVRGFQSHPKELEDLLTILKKKCGTGGSVGDNTLEIQGDQRQQAERILRDMGYAFKASKN